MENSEELSKNKLSVRLYEFMLYESISKEELASIGECSIGTVQNILKGKNFSSGILIALATAYPQLNMKWLLSGKGTMLHQMEKPQWGQMLQELNAEYLNLPPLPEKVLDKKAKARSQAYYEMLDRGLDLYFAVVGEMAGHHKKVIKVLMRGGIE